MEDGNVVVNKILGKRGSSIDSHLIANVELSAPRGGARGRQVGQDDGGQHRAPPGLHDHHAEDLALGLGDDHLQAQ